MAAAETVAAEMLAATVTVARKTVARVVARATAAEQRRERTQRGERCGCFMVTLARAADTVVAAMAAATDAWSARWPQQRRRRRGKRRS